MALPPHRSSPSGPQPIGRVMSRLMARAGYDREHAAAELEAAWRQAAPESLRTAGRPGLVKRGVLDVFVTHSALVQEFGFHKRETIDRLRALVPTAGITDIRCRLAPAGG